MAEQVPDDDSLLTFSYDDSQYQQHHQTSSPSRDRHSTPHQSPQHHNQQYSENASTTEPGGSGGGGGSTSGGGTNTMVSNVGSTSGSTGGGVNLPPPPPPPPQTHVQQQQQSSTNLPPPPHILQQQQYNYQPPQRSPIQHRMTSISTSDQSLLHHPQPLPSPPIQSSSNFQQPGSATSSSGHQPFSYVSTTASTVPVHQGNTRSSRGPRRRRTSSKRSLEEMILESTIPTNITMGSGGGGGGGGPGRNGPQIGLLTGISNSSGLMSPSLGAAATAGPILPLTLPDPPLATATPANPNAMQSDPQPRPKKKSKYTTEQDSIILQMKKDGKTWSEIAHAANCGNALAARNRYQVLIGQQGGGAVVWETEDALSLKALLEEGERAKWEFIASELSRMRSKKIASQQCQRKIKELFDQDPTIFGVTVGTPPTTNLNTPSGGAPPQQQQQPPPPMSAYSQFGGGGGIPTYEMHSMTGQPPGPPPPIPSQLGPQGQLRGAFPPPHPPPPPQQHQQQQPPPPQISPHQQQPNMDTANDPFTMPEFMRR